MKKIFYFVVLFAFCLNVQSSFAQTNQNSITYSSANSLRSELISLDRKITRNEHKITIIKNSRSLSENEKKRKITSLQNENRYLKRKMNKIKSDYRRALSFS